MVKVLISSQRLLGHFLPALNIGLALQEQGYNVTLLGHEQNENYVRGTGIKFVKVGWDKIPNLFLDEFYNEILAKINPHYYDLFFCDSTQPPPAYIAERYKIPWISFQTTVPFPFDLIPGNPIVNKRFQVNYEKNLNHLRSIIHLPNLSKGSVRSRGDLAGISPYKHLVFVYPELLNNKIQLPKNTLLVGNLNNQVEQNNKSKYQFGLSPSKTKILVCTSSIPRIEYREVMNRYIELVIDAYGNDNSYEVIISDQRSWWGKELPSNIYWIKDVPIHDYLLPQVNYVVTHGGCGTLQNVIKYGKPMIIIPLGDDHEIWADLCNQLGISETILPSQLNKKNLLNKMYCIAKSMNTSRNLQKTVLSYNPTKHIVEIIRNFLGGDT